MISFPDRNIVGSPDYGTTQASPGGKCLDDMLFKDEIASIRPSFDCRTEHDPLGTLEGTLFRLKVQVNNTGANDFEWTVANGLGLRNYLFREPVYSAGPYGTNSPYKYNYTNYEICLPKNECWSINLSGSGVSYKGYLGGEEILSSLQQGSVEFCNGRTKLCKDISNDFEYRFRKNGKSKRRETNCESLANYASLKSRKICEARFGEKGRARVKTQCPWACGRLGKGDCEFIKTYADDHEERIQLGSIHNTDLVFRGDVIGLDYIFPVFLPEFSLAVTNPGKD